MRNLMADHKGNELYRLTTLQIRDMQSYVSRLFMLIANESSKLVFIVDNGPWTSKEYRSRPAELWQLMVTQSRVSPFANRRRRATDEHSRDDTEEESVSSWTSFKSFLQQHCKAIPLVKKSPDGFHGCVAFEVEWANVRGINYSNELQTDTCVVLEAKMMVKREFDNIQQAQAWYASESCNLFAETPLLASGAARDNSTTQRLVKCVTEGCYCTLGPPAQSWSEDGSISTDESSGDSDVSQAGNDSEDASDYGTVKSFGGFSVDPDDESRRRDVDFVTPPSSPQANLCRCSDPWTCGWCSAHREDRSLEGNNEQNVLDTMCNLDTRERYEPTEAPLDNEENYCTSSSSNAIESRENTEEEWGLLPSVSKGSFDMGRPPGAECGSDGYFWTEMREKLHSEPNCPLESAHLLAEEETYRDTLVVFRFKEPLLPFELQRIVTADPGLLKMLESGLPSWVIFMQSYPIFSQLYRPWMRPLVGTIYYIISIITVLIGFYDLYKNVPILKATAARLCGPLFEWIEAWEMISRLKYLGTMLILQNFEKAFRWLFMTFRAVKQLTMLLMRPMVEPLMFLGDVVLPIWNMFLEVLLACWSLISMTTSSIFFTLGSLLQFIIWPFCVLLSCIWNLGVYPILVGIWTVLCLPLQMVRLILSIADTAIDGLIDMIQFLVASVSPAVSTFRSAKAATPAPSLWRALWNDIFSKIFRAIRSILNGLVAFLTTCNRHRLSIYNEAVDCLWRLGYMINSGRGVAVRTCQQIFLVQSPKALESKEKVEARDEDFIHSREVLRLRRCISAQT